MDSTQKSYQNSSSAPLLSEVSNEDKWTNDGSLKDRIFSYCLKYKKWIIISVLLFSVCFIYFSPPLIVSSNLGGRIDHLEDSLENHLKKLDFNVTHQEHEVHDIVKKLEILNVIQKDNEDFKKRISILETNITQVGVMKKDLNILQERFEIFDNKIKEVTELSDEVRNFEKKLQQLDSNIDWIQSERDDVKKLESKLKELDKTVASFHSLEDNFLRFKDKLLNEEVNIKQTVECMKTVVEDLKKGEKSYLENAAQDFRLKMVTFIIYISISLLQS